MDPIDYLNKKFGISDVHTKIKQICNESLKNGMTEGISIHSRIFEPVSSLHGEIRIYDEIYSRDYINKYIEYKAELLDMAEDPLYVFFSQPNNKEERVKNIAFYLLTQNKLELNHLLRELKTRLTYIQKVRTIVLFHRVAARFNPSREQRFKLKEFDYVEQFFIDEMRKDRFSDDDLFQKFIFSIDIIGISQLYQLLKRNGAFYTYYTFPEFARLLHKSSSKRLILGLKESNFKNPDIGYLLYLLSTWHDSQNKSEYLNFLTEKFVIYSDRGSKFDFNQKQYKNYIRPYKNTDIEPTKNQKSILDFIETLEKLKQISIG
ncbi:hypothetical protein [Constantimarinum furrinae]|uniref:Uncharacterized protein n=1 Tax=Constantimarinum furrinae TaxID=2562285 RepID=A0A7G8PXQ2_9FLAO|nr:hypothetical protein [Constantimarinum furrinae]QNJ99118.1 hypothetical protein ALE3EI_2588 [Constantimarinum furrinae]